MKLADYRRFKMAVRVSVPADVAADILGKFDDLRDIIYGIQSTARMIVETQTEMHPAHKELVQMIVDATEQVEFEQPVIMTVDGISVRRVKPDGTTGPNLIEPPDDDDLAGWRAE